MAVIPFSGTGKFSTSTAGITTPDGALSSSNAFDLLRIPDIDPTFSMLNDGSALFYRILSMLSKEAPHDQPRFEYFEDDKYQTRTLVAGACAIGDTSIVLDDDIAIVNTVLYFPATDQAMLVTARTGVGTYTVERGYINATDANVADNAEVILMGASLGEGADANEGIASLPTKNWNYISFFSQACKSTDVQELSNMLNGAGQLGNEFKKQTLFLMEQVDHQLRWGTRGLDSLGGGAAYYTGGFNSTVTGAETTAASGLTWAGMNSMFNPYFMPTASSPTKTLICGQGMFSSITKVAWDHFTTGGTPEFQASLGATVQQVVLDGGGVVDVVLDKYGFRNAGQTNQGFLMDMANLSLTTYNGFDMVWREITDPKSHTKKHELYSSAGLKVLHDETHATVKFT